MSESKTPRTDWFVEGCVRKHISAIEHRILKQELDCDIAALGAKHAEEIARLRLEMQRMSVRLEMERHENNESRREINSMKIWADKEIATLRAKMATMVCGTCLGSKLAYRKNTGPHGGCQDIGYPCPVCQPKKEG